MSAPPDKDSEITVFSRAYSPAVFYPYKLSSIQKTNHTTDKKEKTKPPKKRLYGCLTRYETRRNFHDIS